MYKAKIISNLEQHPAKWVNPFVTLSGLIYNNYEKGKKTPGEELEELIRDGIVEKDTIQLGYDKFDRPIRGDLYRYTPAFGPRGSKLTLVK